MISAASKLKNRNGATMLLALVFFLLCTVIASILLVASTASTGRLSGMAENDARYYSLSSAAELLCDGLEEKPVTVRLEKKTVTETVTPYAVDALGNTVKGSSVSDSKEYYSAFCSADGLEECTAARGISLLTDFALDLAAGTGPVNPGTAWSFEGPGTAQERELCLEPDFGNNLKVEIGTVLSPEGLLTLTLSSGEENGDVYKLRISLSAELKRENSKATTEGEPVVVRNSESSYTETLVSEVTETKTCTVVWKLTGVERVSS